MSKLDVHFIIGQIGAGKTTAANKLRDAIGVTPIDRDVIREDLGITTYDPADTARIDEIVWHRVFGVLRNSGSVSVGTASAMRFERRRPYYTKIGEISTRLGRNIETVLIECTCDPEEAKRRIASRPKDGAATCNPSDYDKIASICTPPTATELINHPLISFIRFNTQTGAIEYIIKRPHHQRALEKVAEVLA